MTLIRSLFYIIGICVFLAILVYLFPTSKPVQFGQALKDSIIFENRLPEPERRETASAQTEKADEKPKETLKGINLDETHQETPVTNETAPWPSQEKQSDINQTMHPEEMEYPEQTHNNTLPGQKKEDIALHLADRNTLTTEQTLKILKALSEE